MNLKISDAQRRSMAETGKAFYIIRQLRLFRQDYPSFEEYVRRRWQVPMEYVEVAIELYLVEQN